MGACGYCATYPYPLRRLRHHPESDHVTTIDNNEREQGAVFQPKFDNQGLLGAIVTHAETHEVLMFAFMDEEALTKTRETGFAHFHSRSRGKLWMKGETSGHVLHVQDILVDCDQDALVLKVLPAGPACHTGAVSCFYRRLDDGALVRVSPPPLSMAE